MALEDDPGGRTPASENCARFRTEAEAIARLQHPGIVQVFEVGEHDGMPFFSLEFCAGGSLADKLDGTPLPPQEAARLVEELARAVQAAHDKGIVHRDLKPANVLLDRGRHARRSPTSAWRRSSTTAGQTQTGAVMGTPSYMAPEQAEGKTRSRAGGGRLRAGGDPVRVPDGPAAVPGGDGDGHAAAGGGRRAGAGAAAQRPGAARPGDDLSEVPAEGAGQALRQCGGAGGRPAAASWRASRSRRGRWAGRSGRGAGAGGTRWWRGCWRRWRWCVLVVATGGWLRWRTAQVAARSVNAGGEHKPQARGQAGGPDDQAEEPSAGPAGRGREGRSREGEERTQAARRRKRRRQLKCAAIDDGTQLGRVDAVYQRDPGQAKALLYDVNAMPDPAARHGLALLRTSL